MKTTKSTICLIFLLLFITVEASAFTIKIKKVVVSPSNIVRLKDIALFDVDSPSMKNIEDTPILKLENMPSHIVINKKTMERLLLDHFSEEFLSFCEIPDRIHIYRGKTLLKKDKLVSLILNFIKDHGMNLMGDIKIRNISIPDYIILGADEDIEIQNALNSLRPGHNSINFVIKKNGLRIKSLTGSFFLDVYRPVPCAKRPLNIGEKLTFDKITFVKKNLAYLPRNLWDGKTGPYRVKVPIGAMQPITMDRIEPLPTIVKGQKVILIFDGKTIFLKTIARAMEDGKIGDIIRVMNLQSKKIVYGEVINRDTVRVGN